MMILWEHIYNTYITTVALVVERLSAVAEGLGYGKYASTF